MPVATERGKTRDYPLMRAGEFDDLFLEAFRVSTERKKSVYLKLENGDLYFFILQIYAGYLENIVTIEEVGNIDVDDDQALMNVLASVFRTIASALEKNPSMENIHVRLATNSGLENNDSARTMKSLYNGGKRSPSDWSNDFDGNFRIAS